MLDTNLFQIFNYSFEQFLGLNFIGFFIAIFTIAFFYAFIRFLQSIYGE